MSNTVSTTSEIKTEGLVKSFGARTVVAGVSVHFRAGEVVGLLGPNGAGKTTTFYMIVGLIPASSGRVAPTSSARTPTRAGFHGMLAYKLLLRNSI